jgi:hypothetical protein
MQKSPPVLLRSRLSPQSSSTPQESPPAGRDARAKLQNPNSRSRIGPGESRRDADIREDADREDHHARGRERRHHRQCQGQDPGPPAIRSPSAFSCLFVVVPG